jgi:pyruvate kinase
MAPRTKIVATVGPASAGPDVLRHMLSAGVNVVRLNLSHGELGDHLERLAHVRAAAEELGIVVAVLADLPGPKVRAGRFPDGGVELLGGSDVVLAPGDVASTASRLEVDYPTLADDLKPGDRIVIGDGAISLRVVGDGVAGSGEVCCTVATGGRVQGSPGVHLPSERLRTLAPTDEDLEYAVAMSDAGVDFLAVSFVRSARDLLEVRKAIQPARTALVAKIETVAAIDVLDDIVREADAVMVARGDLGIECPLEDVPHLQKRIVRACVEAGVPVITATQVMESMITSPSPTRAEVSDIANAVFDGTDALMLSAETAIGVDPVAVVSTMCRVAERAELEAGYAQWATRLGRVQFRSADDTADRITMAITHAAITAANDAEAAAILCCTQSGRTAAAMARFRPTAKLLGLSPDPATVRRMALTWGVVPLQVGTYESTDEMVWFAVESAVSTGQVVRDDTVLVLAGAPDRTSGASTDVLRIVRVS